MKRSGPIIAMSICLVSGSVLLLGSWFGWYRADSLPTFVAFAAVIYLGAAVFFFQTIGWLPDEISRNRRE